MIQGKQYSSSTSHCFINIAGRLNASHRSKVVGTWTSFCRYHPPGSLAVHQWERTTVRTRKGVSLRANCSNHWHFSKFYESQIETAEKLENVAKSVVLENWKICA